MRGDLMNFHSDEWIMARLQEHYDEALTLFPEDRIVGIFYQGSGNYGLDIENSDVDTKLIVTPTWEDICFNKKPISTTHHRENDEHIDLKDIRLYIQTFRKQNLNFVEILFTKYLILNPTYEEDWMKLVAHREEIARYYPLGAVRTMKGIAMEKYHAMKHRYPSKLAILDKYGYDPKQLHHLFRVREFLYRYTMEEPYEDCLTSRDAEFLKEVKQGKYTLKEAEEAAEELKQDIEWMYNVWVNSPSVLEKPNERVDVLLDDAQRSIMKTAIQMELYSDLF